MDEPAKVERKRRVKNPETFRERALKAKQPVEAKKRRRFSLGFIFRPFKSAFHKLAQLKLLKPLGPPLRLIGKILLPPYLRNSWKELRLVKWPTLKESRQLTYAVIIFAVIFGAAIAAVDFGLDKLFKQILLK